ncbi:hypothetical protein [Mesorhizobium sp. WSM3224]|uniref:hypothetical protein n=1 Tax=Mesorhizobium sp. WSM3224 TaxID=1040986 RepID=UPI0004875013|nr:hypothetical protein [Mesorhizobium sp. WSM3224]
MATQIPAAGESSIILGRDGDICIEKFRLWLLTKAPNAPQADPLETSGKNFVNRYAAEFVTRKIYANLGCTAGQEGYDAGAVI